MDVITNDRDLEMDDRAVQSQWRRTLMGRKKTLVRIDFWKYLVMGTPDHKS